MKLAVTTGLILLLGSTCLHAQQALVGTYSGSYEAARGRNYRIGLTLQITSAENGVIKATADKTGGGSVCNSRYKLEGTYQDDKIQLTSDGGRTGDCTFRLQLTVEGNKLVGKMDSQDVQLSK